MRLRPMQFRDLRVVSELGIRSKAFWGYTTAQMAVFTEELTHGPELIERSLEAHVAVEEEVVGYFTLVQHDATKIELDFMFVEVGRMGQGIGTLMMQEALRMARGHGAKTLTLIADPNAVGFYERFGAQTVGEHQSSIPGRMIPVMELKLG